MSLFAITFVVNLATTFFKKVVFPRFGRTGVQVILFICALIGAVYYQYLQHVPSIKEIVAGAIAIFSMAIALYEVILSRFSFFQSSDTPGLSNTNS